MSFLRSIIAAVLLLGWLPAVNGCILASAFPSVIGDPCSQPCGGESSGLAGTNSCADCSTLEKGLSLSSLTPIAVPIPDRRVDGWLTDLLIALAAKATSAGSVIEHSFIPPEPPLWQLISRTALPVRGPSLT